MPEVCATSKIPPHTESSLKEESSSDDHKPLNNKCMGCGLFIQDQYIFKVLPDMQWHERCLKCSECMCKLNENTTCFVKNGQAYCKHDYIRLFSVKCDKCGQLVKRNDLVMKSRSKTFHYECFSCNVCHKKLQPGDEYQLVNDLLFCKEDLAMLNSNSNQQPQFNSPTFLNHHSHLHQNQQLYLGNLQAYVAPSAMLTPESSTSNSTLSSFSPNTNSSTSTTGSSSVVDSPASSTHSLANLSNTSITLNNTRANHSYLFNSSSLPAHNAGFTPLTTTTNGGEPNAKQHLYVGATDLHDKEGKQTHKLKNGKLKASGSKK